MLEKYNRKLTVEERRIIEKDTYHSIKNLQKGVSTFKKILWILLFSSLFGVFLIFIFTINSFLGWLGATTIVFFIIGLWTYLSESIKTKRKIQDLSTFVKNLLNYEVEVIHCKSNKVIVLHEWEDLGVHFVFQVEPNKMFFLGGQEYTELRKLPNSDFEIVNGRRNNHSFFWRIFTKGEKLKPIKIISSEEVNELYKKGEHPSLLFDDLGIIEGKIENFEEIIQK